MEYGFRFAFMITDGTVNKVVDVVRLINLLPKCPLCGHKSFIVGLELDKTPFISFLCKDCGAVFHLPLCELNFESNYIEFEIITRLKAQIKELEKFTKA